MVPSSPASPTLLEAADLWVWRGDRCLASGLSFALAAGEAVWLRGPNGVGKTSLLRVLAGLGAVERGALRWRGRDPAEDPAAFRAELLYLGHLDALKRALTPRENLSSDGAMRVGVAAMTIDQALDRLGVASIADLPVSQLSAGQRRRVALARLALSRAPLWLLDEPTTNLDSEGQDVVAGLIDEHLGRGGTALVASHLPLRVTRAARELTLAAPAERAA